MVYLNTTFGAHQQVTRADIVAAINAMEHVEDSQNIYECDCGLSAVYSSHTTWSWPTQGPILIQLPWFHQAGRRATWKLRDMHGVRGLLIHRGQTAFVGHYRYAHVEGCRITVLDAQKYYSCNVVSEYLRDEAYIL